MDSSGCSMSSGSSGRRVSLASESSVGGSRSGASTSSGVSVSNSGRCPPNCDLQCCQGGANRPPYAKVMPEHRRYGVVVSNEEDSQNSDYTCVLKFLLKRFEQFEEVSTINFSECTAVENFDSKLLIVCTNDHSKEWVIREIQAICPPFKCTSFLRQFLLVRVSFVLPLATERQFCMIFLNIERHNDLNTGMWCVVNEVPLDPCSEDYESKVVFPEVDHLEIAVYIDPVSAVYIKKHCSQIRYLSFHLDVDFCPTI
ncbi:hypothetical protein KR084_007436 [Drosophila pseudotakahashii]|nr:hypothetical protein KR084_007436 [Drosophila pseudotakahashii]